MNVCCRLVLERDVVRVCDDFEGFGALVREIGNRLSLLSRGYSTQSALVTELSSLKNNVALHDSLTSSDTEAFARLSKCYGKVRSEVFSFERIMAWFFFTSGLSCALERHFKMPN